MTTPKFRQIAGLFVVFVALMALLLWLAGAVQTGRLLPFDEPVMRWLHDHTSAGLTLLLLVFTQLGGGIGVTMIVGGVVLWLAYQRLFAKMWFVVLAVGGTGVLNVMLKLLFERERPDFWAHLVHETSYSFPSGHAMGSAALAYVVIFLLWHTRWHWWSVVAGSIYMLLVGVSRMYLGVHYPSDVVAGWAVSLIWVSVVYGVLYGYTKRKQRGSGNGKSARTSGD